jgi:hypothetical protein
MVLTPAYSQGEQWHPSQEHDASRKFLSTVILTQCLAACCQQHQHHASSMAVAWQVCRDKQYNIHKVPRGPSHVNTVVFDSPFISTSLSCTPRSWTGPAQWVPGPGFRTQVWTWPPGLASCTSSITGALLRLLYPSLLWPVLEYTLSAKQRVWGANRPGVLWGLWDSRHGGSRGRGRHLEQLVVGRLQRCSRYTWNQALPQPTAGIPGAQKQTQSGCTVGHAGWCGHSCPVCA